jgi:peptide-methionine (S)-S-oxide reductase
MAEASKARQEAELGRTIYTEIIPFSEFYLAEDYHQKYYLRQERALAREFQRIYPDLEDFVNSTAVTRANGYVAGNGSLDQLQAELDNLGLSPQAKQTLLDIASRYY